MSANQVIRVHMKSGNDDTSYSNNSSHQKIGILKSRQVLKETLKEMLSEDGIPSCFKMADLGCSSGPNTLSILSHIIQTIEDLCREKSCCTCSPEFQVFLNDLPQNDFNNIFKMLPTFFPDNGSRRQVFVSGLPASFYGRILPNKSLNFVYSSFSIHWLSQVPKGVVERNGKNIHMATTSPAEVFEAYAKQFETDFSTFLRARGEEMVGRGRMVLLFVARSAADHDPSSTDDWHHFVLLAEALADMVIQGVIKEEDLQSFNLPLYPACKEEVEAVINGEGSFNLDAIQSFRIPWDAHVSNGERRGELVSSFVRACTEPVLAAHFGTSIINDLFQTYAYKLSHYLSTHDPSFFHFILTLSKT